MRIIIVHLQMNRGMIHGSEIWVEPASKENGYIELPPDVEDQPWARICNDIIIIIINYLYNA